MEKPIVAADHPRAGEVAASLERLVSLIRWLSPPGLSLTSAATLATLEKSGPCRLTDLAAREGVTQPAMTQLVARLADSGLVDRCADPGDGRVVHVRITDAGRDLVARRRASRAERLSGLMTRLSQEDQDALAAALPAMQALASVRRDPLEPSAQD
jgi:DNA-binding MarR family transcriptional regulator